MLAPNHSAISKACFVYPRTKGNKYENTFFPILKRDEMHCQQKQDIYSGLTVIC